MGYRTGGPGLIFDFRPEIRLYWNHDGPLLLNCGFAFPPARSLNIAMRSFLTPTLPLLLLLPVHPGLLAAEEHLPQETAASQQEWPFFPPREASPPKVDDTQWARSPIDQFVLRRLEERGLRPAKEADRRTLIRRLYFDLIGLPPSPEEVQQFAQDTDPRAYENLTDRLLNSPHYGERWARFWLDLARYADTAGYEGDPDLPHVWRYRDYVIHAFNTDKPYDRFIKEQLAGDEFNEIMGAGDLPSIPPENMVAMTFLRLAPFTEPRGDETRHELLSEMTATVSSVFLGLTVGCAKCHDHKYDRIPTKDFYRMKAFFATIQIPRPEPGDIYQIGGPLPAAFYREGSKEWAQQQRERFIEELTDIQQTLDRLEPKAQPGRAGFGIQAVSPAFGNDYVYDQRPTHDGKLHSAIINAHGGNWEFFTDGVASESTGSLSGRNRGHWFAGLDRPTHITLGQHSAGTGSPKGNGHQGDFAEILIYDHPLDEAERRALAQYIQQKYASGASDQKPSLAGLQFWLDAADLDADPRTPNPEIDAPVALWRDKVNGIALTQDQIELQPKMARQNRSFAVAFDTSFLWGPARDAPFLKDIQGAVVAVFTANHTSEGYGLEVGGQEQFLSTVIYPSARGTTLSLTDEDQTESVSLPALRSELASRKRFVERQLKRLKPVATSLRHSYGPPYEPRVPTSRVMIRGEWDNPGEVVEPGFLSCITGNQDAAPIRLDPFKRWPTRSRRMALAQWIASPDNPLTARVMMNRLWHWHFGRGIVPTPSDFGKLSGGPSHPELLDWLALQFVKHKWSIKAMHRMIVNTSTYRQSSVNAQQLAARTDPDNTLLWRFRPRRLEAEAVRDNVLAVSGRLNKEVFGLPIFPALPADIAERVKYGQSKWGTQAGPESRKRSIYIYQQRTLSMPLMQVFDSLVCDESRPRRQHSVTPLQALAMYNGDFTNSEAQHFAARVAGEAGVDCAKRVNHAFWLSLGRAPTAEETNKLTAFLQESVSADEGLLSLCRILYNSNEFIHID